MPLIEPVPFSGEATATVVEITHGVSDPRLQITETLGPAWETHLLDVNIALGNPSASPRFNHGPTKLTVTTTIQGTGL